MGRAHSHKRSRLRAPKSVNPDRCSLAVLIAVALLFFAPPAAAAEIALVPGAAGDLGAFLASGPVLVAKKDGNQKPASTSIDQIVVRDGDEKALSGRLGRSLSMSVPGAESSDPSGTASHPWRLVAGSGAIDLSAAFGHPDREGVAFLFGVLRLATPLKGALLIGASDGIAVWVDRRLRLSNDGVRYARDDEDMVALDLPAGDHPILLKLHHRQSPWALRIRLVDQSLSVPQGARLILPGTTDRDLKSVIDHLLSVRVDRGLDEDGYHPTIELRFDGGLPESVERSVQVEMTADAPGAKKTLFRSDAGELPLSSSGAVVHRIILPSITGRELSGFETTNSDGDGGTSPSERSSSELSFRVETAGRSVTAKLAPQAWMRRAMAEARQGAALCHAEQAPFLSDPETLRTTFEHLASRIRKDVGSGETDLGPARADAEAIHEYLTDFDRKQDPLRSHAGIRRFAYRSPIDGAPSPFGLYVPPSYDPRDSKKHPLIVALHGMNGKPLSVLGWFFGKDEPGRDSEWEDRHPEKAPSIDAFVLAPNAFGNAMYRELGEADVLSRLDWAERTYPIDKNRVTITGLSMGGTGTAYLAFHYPDRFAAAEPLCGYHSYFIRGDVAGKPLRPWERLLCEQRSTVAWAENGLHLPLYVWHGKRDYPEKNSGVLIQRYKQLGYAIEEQHPNVGHDVWKKAYADLGGYHWLTRHSRKEHERHVLFRTDSLRYADNAWVHVRALARNLEFGQIDATIRDDHQIDVTARGITAFALDRDPDLVSSTQTVVVRVDGQEVSFPPGSAIELARERDSWTSGPPPHAGLSKRAGLSGPIRDVFYEPLVFVYGTQEPEQTRANQDTARAWARIRWGVDAKYPVVADEELDEGLASSHSLVLVGNARSNRVLSEIEADLPFHVMGDKIVASRRFPDKADGSARKVADSKVSFRGTHLGIVFVYPNPKHPDRYVLVIEGADAFGTIRSLALPDLLPDYLVYDEQIAPARGQIVLGNARPLAAGMFDQDWSLTLPQGQVP